MLTEGTEKENKQGVTKCLLWNSDFLLFNLKTNESLALQINCAAIGQDIIEKVKMSAETLTEGIEKGKKNPTRYFRLKGVGPYKCLLWNCDFLLIWQPMEA